MKPFYYDSNACWGNCTTLKEVVEKAQLQMGPHGACKDLDAFLDNSLSAMDNETFFGTRREHVGPKTLRQHLEEQNLLQDFISLVNPYVMVNVKETEANSLSFHINDKPILELRPDGDILYKGEKIENNQQIVDGMKAFVNSTIPWRDPVTDPPKKSGTYLVTIQGKTSRYVQEAFFKENNDTHKWIEPYYGQVTTDPVENVVGWIHLPEAYKE